MKLFIVLFIVIITSCHLNVCKRLHPVDLKLKMLANQLAQLKGVSKYNLFIERHTINWKIVDKLQGLLTKTVSMVSFKRKSMKWVLNERKDFYAKSKYQGKSREQKGLLNYPSGNALLIYVFTTNVIRTDQELTATISFKFITNSHLVQIYQKCYSSY